MSGHGFHEDLRRQEAVEGSSERSFGIVFAVVFAIIALWPLLDGELPRLWAAIPAALFLLVAFVRPVLLRPLNRLWLKFGLLLHRIVSPLVLGLIFFTTVTPIGLLRRVFGGDPLGLHPDRARESYWVLRDPPGPAPETMRNQF